MTRFKEQKRIEAAIKYKNRKELLWSLEYCENRLNLAKMKEHKKHWNKLIKDIKNELGNI